MNFPRGKLYYCGMQGYIEPLPKEIRDAIDAKYALVITPNCIGMEVGVACWKNLRIAPVSSKSLRASIQQTDISGPLSL